MTLLLFGWCFGGARDLFGVVFWCILVVLWWCQGLVWGGILVVPGTYFEGLICVLVVPGTCLRDLFGVVFWWCQGLILGWYFGGARDLF